MPWQNRVTPAGDLVAVPERGELTGNRGVLHDDRGVIVRRSQVRRWICCELEFRGRHREVMAPRRYTHLFFLDEATALAAGHRPCAECRHVDHQRFRRCWAAALGLDRSPSAGELDDVLHLERALVGGRRATRDRLVAGLPDGVMVVEGGAVWLVRGGRLLRWSPSGYSGGRRAPASPVAVLTPPTVVQVIEAGYRPRIHGSAEPGQ